MAKPMPTDFRNRIVGARMMKDGLSPYFFIWKNGYSLRYFDPAIHRYDSVSKSTATPFFHYVFGAMADLPQFQLNILWIIIEYFTLAACCCFTIFLCPIPYRKKITPLIVCTGVVFTYTLGWRMHVYEAQNYIFIPLFLFGCIYFIKQKFNVINAIVFSLFAASLILLRPVAVLIFVPFLLNFKFYLKWLLFASAIIIAYCLFVLSNPLQQKSWTDYFKSVQVHARQHQLNWFSSTVIKSKNYIIDTNSNPIKFIEGVYLDPSLDHVDNKQFEPSNLFIFFDKLFSRQLSVQAMETIGFIACLCMFSPLLIIKKRKIILSPEILMMLGFCMYDVFTFCQPIGKGQYVWVEFLFPLLLLPIVLKKVYLVPISIVVTGVIFNIFMFHFIKMRHTVGEFMILLSLLFFIYRPLLISYLPLKKCGTNNLLYWF